MKIPGFSFSLKRAVGVTKIKQKVSKATGIPMTKQGLERKIGGSVIKAVKVKKRNKYYEKTIFYMCRFNCGIDL